MDEFREMRRALCEGTAEVLEKFGEITHGEPWLSLPQQYSVNNLRELIRGLAESALGGTDTHDSRRRKVWAAALHGEHRLTHGFSEHLIFTEYHLLRQAVWRFLQGHFPDHPQLWAAISRIDAAISLSTVASLRGYHRHALEAQNQWPEAIERLVEGVPFTKSPSSAASLNPSPRSEPTD